MNYYHVLGVKQEANDEEIRKAYRRLLKKFHPDHSGSNATAGQFHAVRQAYQNLSDSSLRKAHDEQLKQTPEAVVEINSPREAPPADYTHSGSGEFADLFRQVFKNRYQDKGQVKSAHGKDVHLKIELDIRAAHRGGKHLLKLPGQVHPGLRVEQPVDLPAGLLDGATIRFPARGYPGVAGGKSGDLLLTIRHKKDPLYRLDGRDLVLDVKLKPWDFILGAELSVQGMDGEFSAKVPEGTRPGAMIRLPGMGFAGKPAGDMLLKTHIELPKVKNAVQKQAWLELKDKLKDS